MSGIDEERGTKTQHKKAQKNARLVLLALNLTNAQDTWLQYRECQVIAHLYKLFHTSYSHRALFTQERSSAPKHSKNSSKPHYQSSGYEAGIVREVDLGGLSAELFSYSKRWAPCFDLEPVIGFRLPYDYD